MDTASIKLLREKTKASYAECKKALIESNGNLEAAEVIIRGKGRAIIEKKDVDNSAQGIIHSYIHPGSRIGTIVEIKCSTDFVAKTDEFKQFAKEVSLQIAAMKPRFVSRAEIPLDAISEEMGFRITRLKNDGIDEDTEEFIKLLDAEMELWYAEICLLEQVYIRDNKKKIQDLLDELAAKVNESCRITRFERWEIGTEYNKEKAAIEPIEEPKSSWILTGAIALFIMWFAFVLYALFYKG